ncbi:MAG: hypothetical protein ACXAD7_12485 [Candidatus Kariarchaeaceae archaeon]|jgi:hypothetical protein
MNDKMNKWYLSSIIYLILIILLGLLISSGINSFIAIKFEDKSLPAVVPPQSDQHPIELPLVSGISSMVVPTGAGNDDLYNRSLTALQSAIFNRTGTVIPILEDTDTIPAGKAIVIGDDTRNLFIQESLILPSNFGNDSFLLRSYTRSQYDILAIIGGSKLGDAYGAYWLADEIQTGSVFKDADVFHQNITIVPDMKYRMVEQGGVGMIPDTVAWLENDYSLNNREYEDLFLEEDPYIDNAAFSRIQTEFKEYVHRMISFGYNYIIMNGFLEYINFDYVGDGNEIYDSTSEFRARQIIQREKFGQLYAYANNLGMKVIAYTDMLALSNPLQNYLTDEFGEIDTLNDNVWNVYQKGMEELFDEMPYIDGLMIRIGEAGSAYNLATELYTSELLVKDTPSVKKMLNSFIDVMEQYNKTLFFRTWSVGVGEVGDMHTNPDSYMKVLGDINSPNLVVSTKYTMGDFYEYLPFNPTLLNGSHKRIVEFQARREFEGFNAFPNDMGSVHQAALQFAKQNKNLVGIWIWAQNGGPMRAGPMSIYPFHGFWSYTDLNLYTTAKLSWNATTDLRSITEGWVIKNFGSNSDLVYNMTQMFYMSHDVMKKGLYIGEFAEETVLAFGLEPPPMLWIFEWDRLVGVTSVLSAIYLLCKDNLDEAINEGFEAVNLVKTMKGLVSGFDEEIENNSEWYDLVVRSVDYEISLFETLAWYRKYFLNYYAWVDTGEQKHQDDWKSALKKFEEKKEEHVQAYDDDLDFPAYFFEESDAAIKSSERNQLMTWLARIIVVFLFGVFVLGSSPMQKKWDHFFGKNVFRTIFIGSFKPWEIKNLDLSKIDSIYILVLDYLIIIGGFAVFSSFLSPFATLGLGILITSRLLSIHLLFRKSVKPRHLLAGTSPTIYLMFVIIIFLSLRGPILFWYLFWVNPTFRTCFLIVFFVLIFWQFLVIYSIVKTSSSLKSLLISSKVLIQFGVWWLILGILMGISSLETSLTTLNKELLLIPFALSDILGITVHLDIPQAVPTYLSIIGLFIIIIGSIIELTNLIFSKINRTST